MRVSEGKDENPRSRAGAAEGAQSWNLGQVRGPHRITPSRLGSGLLSATIDTICRYEGVQPPDPGVSHRMGTWQNN